MNQLNWPTGLNVDVFLREYWQRRPLVMPQALPDFNNPLSPDELAGLATEDDIHSRLISQHQPGSWGLRVGPFTDSELTTLPAAGWSLLVSDVEKHLEGFQTYLAPFRFLPDWRVDDLMISYAPTGGSVGPHVDQYDVFLLQAAGRREWSIGTAGDDDSLLPDLDLRVLANFSPVQTACLGPGDILYLPPGIPHHGVSLDNHCMTWSIGFRAPTPAEWMVDMAQAIAQELGEARYQDPQPIGQGHPGELSIASIRELRRVWDEGSAMDDATFARLAGRILTQRTTGSPAPDDLPAALSAASPPFASATVRRDGAARLLFIPTRNRAQLCADGAIYDVSLALAECLCDAYAYAPGAFTTLLESESDRNCLYELWRREILFID